MVAPIVVKPLTTFGGSDGGQYVRWRRKQRSVQKAPFTLPAPYFLEVGSTEKGGDNSLVGSPDTWADQIASKFYDPAITTQLANESYEKLRSKIYDSAGLGVDFVERHQSINMIATTCGTMLKFAREVRKLHFGDAAKTLRMALVPKGVDPRKSFGSNFLAYHFGWEPLIHDVYDAMEVINSPLKSFAPQKASAKREDRKQYHYDLGSIFNDSKVVVKYTFLQGATVRSIDSAPLHTLEQMGLINPASLVWEVVPFSFVVDWFANVGDVLRSYTDYAGLTLTDTYSTLFMRSTQSGMAYNKLANQPVPPYSPRLYNANGLYVSRSLGLTKPVFSVKNVKLPSLTRGLTASALLTQFLRNPPKNAKPWRGPRVFTGWNEDGSARPKGPRWKLPR